SISEVYGASGVVDAAQQRATFAGVMAEALSNGYSGIRVAADNSSLVVDPERLEAWIRWEHVADEFMSANHVTGLCAFDGDKVAVDTLRHLATLHPITSADQGVPQFRLFIDDGALSIEGEVDVFAVEHLELALACMPAKTGVVVDLARASLRGRGVRDRLRLLADTGVRVTLLHQPQPEPA
ncbi:MAG TPA: MEDS domain-containing protein, partial [Acidimicrobiales bacterium]|nr:MEDS domain-containing protein [Acidimicrobiales bacterium]